MIIDVADIGLDVREFVGAAPAEILGLAEATDLRVESQIRYKLSAYIAGDELVVRGRVEADVAFLCVRCANFFSIPVCDPSFMRVFAITDKTEPVDLTEQLSESIILAFPTNPLCDPGCKGLCAQCGQDLNKASCECGPPPVDERWSGLGDLKLS